MAYVYNVATNRMTPEELSETDAAFTTKGWVISGFNRLTPENFRVYHWDSELNPDFPAGFGSEPHTQPIVLNGNCVPHKG